MDKHCQHWRVCSDCYGHEYGGNLEAEIARLRAELAEARAERDAALRDNAALRAMMPSEEEWNAIDGALYHARIAGFSVSAACAALSRLSPPSAPAQSAPDRIYPCDRCGKLRTKDEGGTIFTVCDKCWDAPKAPAQANEENDRG